MKTLFFASDKDSIEFTVQITMTLGEWKKLKEQLTSDSHPSWKLTNEIGDVIRQAEKTYRPAKESEK